MVAPWVRRAYEHRTGVEARAGRKPRIDLSVVRHHLGLVHHHYEDSPDSDPG
jgi:hypothetical protein